jgi:hypothetical protein
MGKKYERKEGGKGKEERERGVKIEEKSLPVYFQRTCLHILDVGVVPPLSQLT